MSGNEILKQVLREDTMVIDPGRVLDNSNASEMLEIIYSAQSDGIKYLIMDMAKLEFLSSAGVGSILGTVESFREANGDIVLCNASDNILHVLKVLDLVDYLTIKPDIQEAGAHCCSGK